jgi:hypothetical protein
MGTSTRGMDALIRDLETLPERAADKFPRVLGQGGLNIKRDWQAAWRRVQVHGHIPHLIRAVGYDVHEHRDSWSAKAGVRVPSRQGFLAKVITYGTLTSAPHDAGLAAMDVEDPKYVRAVAEVAQKLLEG